MSKVGLTFDGGGEDDLIRTVAPPPSNENLALCLDQVQLASQELTGMAGQLTEGQKWVSGVCI